MEANKFWSLVDLPNESTGCWNWRGRVSTSGYGVVYIDPSRTPKYAHRIAYEISVGKIRKGLCVCHKCDNKLCCNPNHLFLGTQADNARDAQRKGLMIGARGEKSGSHKLTTKQVIQIRSSIIVGSKSNQSSGTLAKCKRFAKKFGVSLTTIQHIVYRQTWKHLL